MASVKEDAPTGRIMNSCIASALPAWLPPLMMLKLGTGSTCRHFQRGDALQTARGLSTHSEVLWCQSSQDGSHASLLICISDWCTQLVCHPFGPVLP